MYPEVSTSQPAGSIKSVLLVGYRLPGYKIIIKGLFHKFIFTKKKIVKSWRHALKIWKEVFSCVQVSMQLNNKYIKRKHGKNPYHKYKTKNELC